ncbi:hypothetical protein NQ314_017408 [Rhamnusium bicolor]|uniref:Mitochondrial carrier protein n=1 Tax=Rhamnusium bicolor TaxID=1586634 RepID=A0AAV8WUE8_9CUCU|nr:hypothetical protein NQ314_017408 [Rhamnusium bicolor]
MNGCICMLLTQPLDILKTRMMNAKPGEFNGLWDCIKFTSRGGPICFYKGFLPSFIRILPTTVLSLMFYEQLRQNFGYIPNKKAAV